MSIAHRGVDKRCPRTAGSKLNVSEGTTGLVKTKAKSAPFPLTRDMLRGIFRCFDTNGDGRLSRQEIKNVFKSLGSYFPGWRADRAISYADQNGDGYISEDEFEGLVAYAFQRNYTIN